VLIASADVLPALREQGGIGEGEILAFADVEALRALETITIRKPAVVALERMFASTPRGAALITRIKADPSLKHAEIRVVAADDGVARSGGHRSPGPRASGELDAIAAAAAAAPAAVPVQPLDQRGTRRAPRFKVNGHVTIIVDGNQATLIDISTIGAQVLSSAVLKPNQRLRIGLNDEYGDIRLRASVAWASFEISPSGPRYRAGIAFLESNPGLEAYIARHKQN
jgi:hypothetical protein